MAPYANTSCSSSQDIKDCEAVYNCCKGIAGNKDRLVHILARRNATQRKELGDLFYALYKEELSTFLHAELCGNLETAVILWMHDVAERDAIIVKTELKSPCPDFRALTEILCSRTPFEILRIRQAYRGLYKACLDEDIAQETVGPHQKLLFALAKAQRCPSRDVNICQAKCDAKRLYGAREGRIGIDEGAIVKLLSDRNLNHLRAAFGYYKQFYGHDILKALRRESSWKFEFALRIIIKCICYPAKYFCKVLRISLDQSEYAALTRVMVTRAEVDMEEIKAIYQEKYGIQLEQAICKQTSGRYRDFLLQLACWEATSHPK